MTDPITIILYSSGAGITIIIGALISHWLQGNNRFRESGAPQRVIAWASSARNFFNKFGNYDS